MRALRTLEARTGKPHPELQGYRPLSTQFYWLQSAFFRLHRRRQVGAMGGAHLLAFSEISTFGERVLALPPELLGFFVQAMEVTDDAVMSDHYARESRAQDEQAKKPAKRR